MTLTDLRRALGHPNVAAFLRVIRAGESSQTDDAYRMMFGGGLFDVRQQAIGHLQQGGKPSPFDRLLATRLVYYALQEMDEQVATGGDRASYIGFSSNYIGSHDLERMPEEVDEEFRRPKDQWWLAFEPIHQTVSLYGTPMTVPLPVIDA